MKSRVMLGPNYGLKLPEPVFRRADDRSVFDG